MSMPREEVRALLEQLDAPDVANFVAQAEARHVLMEVGEAPENFPAFTPGLDDKVTGLAYMLLAAGCSLAEHGERGEGAAALERGARLLRNAHAPHVVASKDAAFHVLLAAMAAYAAGQYSWAFVLLKGVPPASDTVRLVSAFVRRDRKVIHGEIARVLSGTAQVPDLDADVIELAFARSIARTLAFTAEFSYTGDPSNLVRGGAELDDAATVARESMSPACWWIARLLKLMVQDLEGASPWTVLPPFFGSGAVATILDRYVRLLAFDEARPVYELWHSQREALPHALGANKGAVVSLKTSGGKTRVAELAMLQALTGSDGAKVLFLAPFRSLAFEMEQTLSRTFRPLGFDVSHLYGGARTSRADTELATEARIIVATPEKARALFRAAPDLFAKVKLIVIDEGHLLGTDVRDVRNEMYYEHLRVRAARTGARVLLLSAALPNADHIARWIAGDSKHLGASAWRPSLQRYGLLKWNGSRVRLEWKGDFESFNPKFIVAKPTSARANAKRFPAERIEAVAATAVRLWTDERPVMIFAAQARSIPGIAKAVLKALEIEHKPLVHAWPEREWKVFEAVCWEELPEDAIEVNAARAGVICHSNSLPAQVRIAMEHLMRSGTPRIVIATKTLAQGVNLGVTTVIVASTLVDKGEFVNARDFLNIAGRAGRAFVDVEGKILFTIDDRDSRKAAEEEKRAEKYFGGKLSRVVSGVLRIVHYLKGIAAQGGIEFPRLLEMAAEDDFAKLGEKRETAEEVCDYIDDALLSVHEDAVVNAAAEPPAVWVEKLFRQSLGVLQAEAVQLDRKVTSGEVIAFLRARAGAVLRHASSPEKRKAVVSSSLPFKVALRMFDDVAAWGGMVDVYRAAGESSEAMAEVVMRAEDWAKEKAAPLIDVFPDDDVRSKVRSEWLGGVPLRKVYKNAGKEGFKACRDFYGFSLTWIIHAASQQLRASGDEDRADVLARLSLCVELGLPTERACRIFLAGVRSRAAAVEIANCGIDVGDAVSAIARQFHDPDIGAALRARLTPGSITWLDLLSARAVATKSKAPRFRPFSLPGVETGEALFVREVGDRLRLASMDGRRGADVVATPDLPFDAIANDPRYCFVHGDGAWKLKVRDPHAPQG